MKKTLLITLAVLTSFIFKAEAKKITFEQHIKTLKQELKTKGYDDSIIDKAFENNFKLDKKVKKAVKNQPEVKNTFDKYITSKMAPFRIKQGKQLYKKHHNQLKELEKKYGVDPSIIIALWGLETNYGKYPIKYSPVKSLATISYTHGRKKMRNFFKRELFALFELGKRHNVNILGTKSSWAGALGQCQFMPSNVLAYATDGDNDGKVDIWTNEKDVLASIASFLKYLKWKQYETNFLELDGSKTTAKFKYFRKYNSANYWEKNGIKTDLKDKYLPLKMYSPKNKANKVFLVTKNFAIIKKWNNSDYFAFSALKLAKAIKESDSKK